MNFFKKVQSSIYSPEFYSQIPKQSFGTALKYFLLLVLLVTVLRSIVPLYDFVTVGQKEIEKVAGEASNIYPSELSVKIKDGKLSTNVEEPYFVPIPEDSSKQNLVVIDTKTPFSTTQFNKYQTIVWVTEDSIFIRDDNQGQLRTIDLSNAENFTLDKARVDSFIDKFYPWLKLITPVVVIAVLVGLFIVNMFTLVYLLFAALLIWLVFKLTKKPFNYGESYKVGMYAVTLGLFVSAASEILGLRGFPFMTTIITLVVVFVNFRSSQNVIPKKS